MFNNISLFADDHSDNSPRPLNLILRGQTGLISHAKSVKPKSTRDISKSKDSKFFIKNQFRNQANKQRKSIICLNRIDSLAGLLKLQKQNKNSTKSSFGVGTNTKTEKKVNFYTDNKENEYLNKFQKNALYMNKMPNQKKKRLSVLLKRSFVSEFGKTVRMMTKVEAKSKQLKREFVRCHFSNKGFDYDSGFDKDIFSHIWSVKDRVFGRKPPLKEMATSGRKLRKRNSFARRNLSLNYSSSRLRKNPSTKDRQKSEILMKHFLDELEHETLSKTQKLDTQMVLKNALSQNRTVCDRRKEVAMENEEEAEICIGNEDLMNECLQNKLCIITGDVLKLKKKIRILSTFEKIQIINQKMTIVKKEELKVREDDDIWLRGIYIIRGICLVDVLG